MANEITTIVKLSGTKNEVTATLNSSDTIDMTGNQLFSNVQSFTTSTEQITIGDVGAPYRLAIKHVSGAGNASISLDNGNTQIIATLNPDDPPIFLNRPNATLYFTASTGTVECAVVAIEI